MLQRSSVFTPRIQLFPVDVRMIQSVDNVKATRIVTLHGGSARPVSFCEMSLATRDAVCRSPSLHAGAIGDDMVSHPL